MIPFLFEMSLENAMKMFGVRESVSFEEILTTKKTMCWKIYG
jgi:hypothetical protein